MQGQALKWSAAEPSHEPVHGPELLCTISATIRRYVDMPDALADATALWIIHTWLHPRLEISTFLNVTSATKRCGKSLLMEVAGALVYRPLLVSGRITPPALFRIIESAAPTLMLDEADTYFGENPELRGVINGSQRLESAWVIRCEGDDHEPRAFNTWCPKVISGIGGLPDTVLDRSLVIRLERRAEHGPQLSRWRDRDKGDLADLCGRIARWVQDNADAVLAARKGVAFPPNPNDRFRDVWEALLAIADTAGGEWAGTGGRAWHACRAIGADTNDETGAREVLLADLQVVFADKGNPNALPTKVILEALHGMEDCPRSEWKRGKSLSPRGLSALLKPFRIAPSTIRLQDRTTPKGYKRTALEPHWKRYLEAASNGEGSVTATTPQPRKTAGSGDFLSATSVDGVADRNP